jgi:hypothetical protein
VSSIEKVDKRWVGICPDRFRFYHHLCIVDERGRRKNIGRTHVYKTMWMEKL